MAEDNRGPAEDDNGEQPTQKATLSLDATLEALANQQRRDLLAYLVDAPDHTASVDDLVTNLMNRAASRTGEVPGHDQLTVSLLHLHLPKLADMGVVEYDERTAEIRYYETDRLEEWLARTQAEVTD